jgi:DNA-binding NtrC family response regulator
MAKQKVNLMVVDDEERFLESIKKRLEVHDFNVITVNRGDKAIEAARENPIDVVLLDLKMPGMNGEKTLAELKKVDRWLEVIILTGHGSTDSVVECIDKGAYFYLQKPCELELLLSVLSEAYRRRVTRKLKIKKERMDDILEKAGSASPVEVLRKIRELDEGDE